MKATTYVFIGVLIFIIGGSFLENGYIKDKFNYFNENLTEITELADNKINSNDKLQELLGWWKGQKHILHAFIPHNEIREIDGIMVEAQNLMNYGEYDLATTRLRKLGDLIRAIPDNYSFNFGNIF